MAKGGKQQVFERVCLVPTCRAKYREVVVLGEGSRGFCEPCYFEINRELVELRKPTKQPTISTPPMRQWGKHNRGRRPPYVPLVHGLYHPNRKQA